MWKDTKVFVDLNGLRIVKQNDYSVIQVDIGFRVSPNNKHPWIQYSILCIFNYFGILRIIRLSLAKTNLLTCIKYAYQDQPYNDKNREAKAYKLGIN